MHVCIYTYLFLYLCICRYIFKIGGYIHIPNLNPEPWAHCSISPLLICNVFLWKREIWLLLSKYILFCQNLVYM